MFSKNLLPLLLASLAVVRAATVPPAALSPITHNEFGDPHTPEFIAELEAKQAAIEGADSLQGAAIAVTTLSAAQVSSNKPFSYYAAAAYCAPARTKAWNCGVSCSSTSGFVTTASGGDGASTQYWYVGYDSALQTVIVGHQGTDADKILPVITNIDFAPRALSTSLFPGVPNAVRVHNGFAGAQENSAAATLAAVRTTLSQRGATKVTVVGHSLGAAIGLLNALYLKIQLGSGVNVQFKGYAMPRVGNPAFANYIDSTFGTSGAIQRINNLKDPVPILPGRFLGFAHTSGEIHINSGNVWDACTGQDNTDGRCTVGAVPNVFAGSTSDHRGPYDGVTISSSTCA
ncbi:Alpha/Beta hydrolase protein [Pterulicium gracile]|uniref:Alpha/Beta hydrolase protein n=1 Tax=Pterulicium gracile TaxID=1884261 RepID=A0A5C3QDX7_9AGAR|nr:Alpha/Beta hydrolase protein [Pterula gracilis]